MTQKGEAMNSAVSQLESWFDMRLRLTTWGRWVALETLYLDYRSHVRAPFTRASVQAWLRDVKGVKVKTIRTGETLVSGVDFQRVAA